MRRSATLRLVCVTAGIGLVWCGLLPAAQRAAVVQRHVAAMELREVNPAAMVYTELERLPLRPDWADREIVLWP